MEQKYCQSCGMKLVKPPDFETEKNGEASVDYCCYCYQNGAFEDFRISICI